MRTSVKSWVINVTLASLGAIALLFSMGATWIILHESISIIQSLPADKSTVIFGSLGIGLVLLWLNSLLLDSVIWTTCKHWKRG